VGAPDLHGAASILDPRTSILEPRSSILDPRSWRSALPSRSWAPSVTSALGGGRAVRARTEDHGEPELRLACGIPRYELSLDAHDGERFIRRMITISASASNFVRLGMPTGMEPSGLAVIYNAPAQDTLFMVSDNGGYAELPLPYNGTSQWDSSPPTNKPDHSDDYECVTFAGNTQLVLVGVEGYQDPNNTGNLTSPVVKQYNSITNVFASYVWTLTRPTGNAKKNSGMEALTYLPNGSVPASWKVTNTLLVLMAVQSIPGKAYVYALPINQGTTTTTPQGTTTNPQGSMTVALSHTLDIPSPVSGQTPAISELYFDAAASILYVLYDDKNVPNDYLQALRWTVSGSTVTLASINVAQMPWKGCEGMAVYGNDLFFATDDGGGTSTNNGVYQITDFIPDFIDPSSR
jgi:hypothetical protein